jgi:predicted oxidoreductase
VLNGQELPNVAPFWRFMDPAMVHQSKTIVDAAADAGASFIVHLGIFGNGRMTYFGPLVSSGGRHTDSAADCGG